MDLKTWEDAFPGFAWASEEWLLRRSDGEFRAREINMEIHVGLALIEVNTEDGFLLCERERQLKVATQPHRSSRDKAFWNNDFVPVRVWMLDTSRFGASSSLLLMNSTGQGKWIANNGSREHMWTSCRVDGAIDAKRLEAQLEQSDSDLRFSLLYDQISYDEVMSRALLWPRMEKREFYGLARAVLRCHPRRLQHSGLWTWMLNFCAEGLVGFLFTPKLQQLGPPELDETDEFLQNWARALSPFAPIWNEAAMEQHPCLQEARNRPVASIRCETPTQHERLEAALQLRDWAKRNVPDQMSELLPPDFLA